MINTMPAPSTRWTLLAGIQARLKALALIATFVFTLALGNVAAGHYLQKWDTFITLWMVFATATALLSAAYALEPDAKPLAKVVQEHFRDILWLNVTTAVSWVTTYYALRSLEPAIAHAVTFAVSPFVVMGIAALAKPRQAVMKAEVLCALGILGVVAYFVAITLKGLSGVGAADHGALVLGFLASAVSGISVAGNTLFSKRLGAAGVSAKAVIATRFYLLALLAFGVWGLGPDRFSRYSVSDYLMLLAIAAVGISLPLFLLQKIIERTAAMTVSFIVILGPIATYLLQVFDPRLRPSAHTLLGIALVVLFIILGSMSRAQGARASVAHIGDRT